jgi:hypothetical protein
LEGSFFFLNILGSYFSFMSVEVFNDLHHGKKVESWVKTHFVQDGKAGAHNPSKVKGREREREREIERESASVSCNVDRNKTKEEKEARKGRESYRWDGRERGLG